ncbi:MAG TPA: chromophore lyase CpcT/CpeT, partial [Thermoanaerobaculia bacterium]
MRTGRAAAAAFLLALGPVALAESRAAEVASWFAGTFEAKDPGPDGGVVRIVIVSVPKSRIANGAPVLYREQSAAPKLDEPWLQRFYRLEEVGDVVRLRAFDPKDPLIVRGKWRDPSTLALYGANDVREKPGCEIVLKKAGARWEGGTRETAPQAACPSNQRNAVRMTSSVTLSSDALVQWDRGFDEKGRQTWGSLESGTRYVKISAGAPVDESLQERTGGRRGEEKGRERDSLKVKEPEDSASAALTATSPSSPSKKYDLAELRALAGAERVTLSRLFPSHEISAAAVVVVTGRTGSVSVFSSAEISSSSSSDS